MTYLHADLAEAFAAFENKLAKKLECFSLASSVQGITRAKFGDDIPADVRAEWMALSFCPDYGDIPSSRDTADRRAFGRARSRTTRRDPDAADEAGRMTRRSATDAPV